MTRLADGRVVVVWSGSQHGDNDVRFQILNAAGVPLTEPASVFGVESASVPYVSVAALADGGFVIRGANSIQRYDAGGLASGPLVTVPVAAGTGPGAFSFEGGEVSALGSGFVTASMSAGRAVVLNFYGADNQSLSQRTIATGDYPLDLQLAVRQGADAASTRIVTTWTEIVPDQFGTPFANVRLQVTDGAGNTIGATLQLDANTIYSIQPDVAFLTDGSFLVSWTYSSFTSRRSPGPSANYIYTQHFSGDGVALGAPAAISGPVFGSVGSSVVALADGGYLITWNSNGVGHAQQYDAQAVKVGAETTFSLTDASGAVLLADGRVMVVGGLQFQILSPNINVEMGNNANNTYLGTAGDDTYSGLTGNDTIRGGAGSDLLYGNEGDDFLYGDAGNDILVGGAGNDVIDGGDGYDVLLLDKPLTNYFVEQTANGYRIWDGAEFDLMTNVEGVYAANGQVYSMAEFQQVSFNGLAYIAGYADLADGYGANALAGYQHYINNGRAEGRGIVFDPVNYLAANSDLARGYGNDPIAAARHFIEHGRFEGRQTGGFNALIYGASNPDLARIYGGNVEALTLHFVTQGAQEGRLLSGFDPLLYGASNADLARVCHSDAAALLGHYLATGADEGRAVSGFNALIYAATHADLARYFGSDANGALLHYLNYGVTEGRAAGGFDSVAYLLSYPDLAGIGANGALLHWLNNGADEGRIGDDVFGREQGAAHTLTGGVGQASLERAGDHDWFQFDLVGGQDAVIRLSGVTTGGGTLTDGWLRLYNEAGVLVATNRGQVGGSDAEITFRPTVGGRYYLVVAGETDTQTGTYRVTVTGAAATVAVAAHEEAAVFGLDAFDDMGTGRDAGAIVGSFDTLAPEGRWSDLADRWLSGAAHLQPTPDHDWMV
ncbi:calcium-binding protein [Brevundimonas sp.]